MFRGHTGHYRPLQTEFTEAITSSKATSAQAIIEAIQAITDHYKPSSQKLLQVQKQQVHRPL
jgi:hypothetical protein